MSNFKLICVLPSSQLAPRTKKCKLFQFLEKMTALYNIPELQKDFLLEILIPCWFAPHNLFSFTGPLLLLSMPRFCLSSTYHSWFKAELFKIVATILAPWLGGFDHIGRMIALSWLRIRSAVSLSVVTTQRLPHLSSANRGTIFLQIIKKNYTGNQLNTVFCAWKWTHKKTKQTANTISFCFLIEIKPIAPSLSYYSFSTPRLHCISLCTAVC